MMQDPNLKKNDEMTRGVAKKKRKKRVALYNVIDKAAAGSAEAYFYQQNAITELINNTAGWSFEKIFSDEAGKKDAFNEMIIDCSAGKIDVIVTKTIWRFAGDIKESLRIIDKLLNIDPPVEVIFTDEAIFTFGSEKLHDLRTVVFNEDHNTDPEHSDILPDNDFIRQVRTVLNNEEKVK